jgi:hypothetical protein
MEASNERESDRTYRADAATNAGMDEDAAIDVTTTFGGKSVRTANLYSPTDVAAAICCVCWSVHIQQLTQSNNQSLSFHQSSIGMIFHANK